MYEEQHMVCHSEVTTRSIVKYQRARGQWSQDDILIEETPIALEYNGIAYTVMMGTPRDLEAFALGFSLSEGIIAHPRDVHDIEVTHNEQGCTVSIELANRCVARLKERRRSMAGVTGCGICGTEQLNQITRCLVPLPTTAQFCFDYLDHSLASLNRYQRLNQLTGTTHAASYLDEHGEVQALFEDVGRHIALDKLLGWASRQQVKGGAVLVTSRASFEMVQKVAACGFEILLALSGPTSMAVELADRLNVTLCGYCREGRLNVYAHAERVRYQGTAQRDVS
ncbi:formate dehydrogenase accessory sulfurtransferase FdhD [Vibrio mytili]|uniref:formate dehydrogenase accessory sulfurtransferase FdhD n=1 Tax=Vibrio mytili TaxID=50718 RepID=UPI003C6FB653